MQAILKLVGMLHRAQSSLISNDRDMATCQMIVNGSHASSYSSVAPLTVELLNQLNDRVSSLAALRCLIEAGDALEGHDCMALP